MTEANSRKAIMAIYLISPIKSLLTVPIALMTKPRLIYPLIVSSSTCLHGQKLFFLPPDSDCGGLFRVFGLTLQFISLCCC